MISNKRIRVLSLDGGGIRGIIPASVLKYIEEYLANKKPGTTLADHFDLIAGTSTGAILTALYLAPSETDCNKARYNASEALNIYQDHGYKIFNESKRGNFSRLWGLGNSVAYKPDYLEELLKKKLGDTTMSQLIKPCLIPTYNMSSKSSYFFTSMENKNIREFYVRDVLRSTTSAPTYFPPAKIKNIAPNPRHGIDPIDMLNLDGGVFANNPTLCAYAEARNHHFVERNNAKPTAKDLYILSFGTGGGSFEIEKIEQNHKWHLLRWAKLIPEIMMDGSVDTTAYQMDAIHEAIKEGGKNRYMRIDVDKSEDEIYSSDMADASPENIDNLLDAGQRTLTKARANGLDNFLDGLLLD